MSSPGIDPAESTTSSRGRVTSTDGSATPVVEGDTITLPSGGGGAAFADALRLLGESAGRTLRLPDEEYRVSPSTPDGLEKWPAHFVVQEFEDATIDGGAATVDGQGATVVFSDPTHGGLHCYDCENLTLQHLAFDYDPLPFTQGTVTAVDRDARRVTVETDDGYVDGDHAIFDRASEEGQLYATLHDPETGRAIPRERVNHDAVIRLRSTGTDEAGNTTLDLAQRGTLQGVEPGRRLVVDARQGTPCLEFGNCTTPSMEQVQVHASPRIAVDVFNCRRFHARAVELVVPDGDDRLIAGNADGIHCDNCQEGPLVEGCTMDRLGDDPIVVDSEILGIGGFPDDRTIAIGTEHSKRPDVNVGDVLSVVSPSGVRRGELPPVESVEIGYEDPRGAYPATVTFAEPIRDRLETTDYLIDPSTLNHGFEIRDNTILNTRGRPVRISSADGVVEDNTIDRSSGMGIELEFDTNYALPKGWVEDVTVRNNRIIRAGTLSYFAGANAGIHCRALTPGPTEGQPNRNVTIVGNEIETTAGYGIDVSDTDGVTIEDNEIVDPYRIGAILDVDATGHGVALENDSDVTVSGTTVTGTSDTLEGFGVRGEGTAVDTEGNRLVIDGEERTPAFDVRGGE
jgi:hypothetical protein